MTRPTSSAWILLLVTLVASATVAFAANGAIVTYYEDPQCSIVGGGPPGSRHLSFLPCLRLCPLTMLFLVGLISNPFKFPIDTCMQLMSNGYGAKVTSCDATVTVIVYPEGCNGRPGQGTLKLSIPLAHFSVRMCASPTFLIMVVKT